MIIQINTDHNIEGKEALRVALSQLITDELRRYSAQITRIEVHLSDEDSDSKDGQNDIRCILEARLEGRQPIAVTNHSDTWHYSTEGAINKLKASLETITGKLKD